MQQNAEVAKKPKRKRVVQTRPPQFKEFEKLAKSILEGKRISYFVWLHEKHQELVNEFNVENMKKISELAREGD